MLLIGLISLLMVIGLGSSQVLYPAKQDKEKKILMANTLYSSTITPTLLTRITSITLLFSAALSFNALYVQAIGSGLGLYSGLFHVTSVTQALEVFVFIIGAFILMPWASEIINIQELKFSNTQVSSTPTIAEYPLIILFTTIGASFLISSCDLVSIYLSIELQSFAVYILAVIYRNSESATSAGLKYFLLGALSSALILLGSSIIYAYTGLTNFESIYTIVSVNNISPDWFISVSHAVILGVLIIGVGFLFKVAAAPFHNWAPDVYDGVPTIVTTWLTVMPKISIFVFLLELQIGSETLIGYTDYENVSSSLSLFSLEESNDISLFFGFEVTINVWKNLLLTTSLLSLVIGTVVGLVQYRLKRLLAFSTISHVGFLLLALSANSEESITSFLFYLMQYSITNLNVFFVVLAFGYIIHSNYAASLIENKSMDISFITQLKGQFHANPVLGLSLAICLFSIAGIPPLVGFFAKYMVLYSAVEKGYYFLAFVGILASVVSAAYYLRIIRVVFMGELSSLENSKYFETFQMSLMNNTHHQFMNPEAVNMLTSIHSYMIAVLTLFITLFILSPSFFLNSSNLLALSLFTA